MLEKKVARPAKAAPKKRAEVAQEMTASSTTKPATPQASRGRQDDLHERVRRRAYELWESQGRPAGRDYDHWLQAEREVAAAPRQQAA